MYFLYFIRQEAQTFRFTFNVTLVDCDVLKSSLFDGMASKMPEAITRTIDDSTHCVSPHPNALSDLKLYIFS